MLNEHSGPVERSGNATSIPWGWLAVLAVAIWEVGLLLSVKEGWEWSWNDARLTPTFAIWHGYRAYYPADHGPVLNTIYGFVTYLFYLPTVAAPNPTAAIIFGGGLSAAIFFAPFVWLAARSNGLAVGAAILAFAVVLTLQSRALIYSAVNIHADAPALGFTGLAFVAGFRPLRRGNLFWMSVLISLGLLSKQTMLPSALGMIIWLSFVHGFRPALVLCLGIAAVSTLAVVSATRRLGSFSDMYFNVIAIPRAHPVQVNFARMAETLWPEVFLTLTACVVFVIRDGWPDCGKLGMRGGFQKHPFLGALLAALLACPLAIAANGKVGGAVNSFSPPAYFLLMGCCCILLEKLSSPPGRTGQQEGRGLAQALGVGLALWFVFQIPVLKYRTGRLAQTGQNPSQQAFDMARREPGRYWFPDTPLGALMAEGRCDHFSYGLYDRVLAGFPVDRCFPDGISPSCTTVIAMDQIAPDKKMEVIYAPFLFGAGFEREVSTNGGVRRIVYSRPRPPSAGLP